MKKLLSLIAIVFLFVSTSSALMNTTPDNQPAASSCKSCDCNPCTCNPCNCPKK